MEECLARLGVASPYPPSGAPRAAPGAGRGSVSSAAALFPGGHRTGTGTATGACPILATGVWARLRDRRGRVRVARACTPREDSVRSAPRAPAARRAGTRASPRAVCVRPSLYDTRVRAGPRGRPLSPRGGLGARTCRGWEPGRAWGRDSRADARECETVWTYAPVRARLYVRALLTSAQRGAGPRRGNKRSPPSFERVALLVLAVVVRPPVVPPLVLPALSRPGVAGTPPASWYSGRSGADRPGRGARGAGGGED